MAASIPSKLRGRARRDAAAFYLSELAKGILSGELAVLSGQQQIAVAISEFVTLDIEVKQRKRGHRVSVTLRWARPGIEIFTSRRGTMGDEPPSWGARGSVPSTGPRRSRKVYSPVILP